MSFRQIQTKNSFVIPFFILLLASQVTAQPLRLRGEAGSCATGFVLEEDGSLVTNNHVAAELCRKDACQKVGVNSESPSFHEVLDLTVKYRFPTLDVAILTPSKPFPAEIKRYRLASRTPRVGEPVRMFGFPACDLLAEGTGQVTEVRGLYLRTDVVGASGSSGSPVVDSNGEVLAVANESDSFLLALSDKLAGASFEMRGSSSENVRGLLALSGEATIEKELSILLDFYRADLQSFSGLSRLRGSVTFLSRVSALRKLLLETQSSAELVATTAFLDQSPGLFLESSLPASTSAVAQIAEQLVFAANLEARGADAAPSEQMITESTRSEEQKTALRALREVARQHQFPGSINFGAVTLVPAALVSLALLFIYGWSLGYVYARAKGGMIMRAIKMILIGILVWPLSFFIWRIVKIGERR